MSGDIYMIAGAAIGIISTVAFVCVRVWFAPKAKETKRLLDSLYEE